MMARYSRSVPRLTLIKFNLRVFSCNNSVENNYSTIQLSFVAVTDILLGMRIYYIKSILCCFFSKVQTIYKI